MESVCVFNLYALVLLMVFPVSSTQGPKTISTHVGEDVTLPCYTSDGVNFEHAAVEWTRPDLGPDDHIFCYRDGRPDPYNQDPSYKGRVEPVHEGWKDGDLSVVLKNVRTNDAGRFECYLIQEMKRRKRSRFGTDPISTINLEVSDPGSSGNRKDTRDEGGHEDRGRPGLILGSVPVIIVVVGVFLFVRRRLRLRRQTQNSENPAENKDML